MTEEITMQEKIARVHAASQPRADIEPVGDRVKDIEIVRRGLNRWMTAPEQILAEDSLNRLLSTPNERENSCLVCSNPQINSKDYQDGYHDGLSDRPLATDTAIVRATLNGQIDGKQMVINQLEAKNKIQEGFVLVPIVPTDEMIRAGAENIWHDQASGEDNIKADYCAMVKARPEITGGEV